MAIGASIKKAVSKVVSSVKNAFSSGSQGASAMNFPVGRGLTPAQTATANKTLGISKTTTGGLTYNTNQAGTVQNTKIGTTPSLNVQKSLSSGGLTLDPVGRVVTPIKVSRTSAPTNVANINTSVPDVNLSSSPSAPSTTNTTAGLGSTGAIAPAVAAVKGLETKTKAQLDLEKLALADEQKKKEDASWLKTMFEQKQAEPNVAQRRADLERQYGIQEKTSEINSLTESLGKVEADVASQVAKTQDIMASNNFINNQVAQINRNSAPIINRLRADINFKTGILTQNRELVAQAISDATAESRQKWEDFKWFRNENQEIEKYISPEYKRALDLRDKQLEWEHSDNVKEHEWKLEMATKYGANIGINDSVQTVLEKIKAVGGRTISDRTGDNASGSSGFKNSKIEADIRGDAVKLLDEVDLGNTTLDKVYTKLRRLYSPNEVTDDAIRNLIGYNTVQQTPSQQSTPSGMTTSSVMPGGKDSIVNPLFGINDWGTTSLVNKISSFLFK